MRQPTTSQSAIPPGVLATGIPFLAFTTPSAIDMNSAEQRQALSPLQHAIELDTHGSPSTPSTSVSSSPTIPPFIHRDSPSARPHIKDDEEPVVTQYIAHSRYSQASPPLNSPTMMRAERKRKAVNADNAVKRSANEVDLSTRGSPVRHRWATASNSHLVDEMELSIHHQRAPRKDCPHSRLLHDTDAPRLALSPMACAPAHSVCSARAGSRHDHRLPTIYAQPKLSSRPASLPVPVSTPPFMATRNEHMMSSSVVSEGDNESPIGKDTAFLKACMAWQRLVSSLPNTVSRKPWLPPGSLFFDAIDQGIDRATAYTLAQEFAVCCAQRQREKCEALVAMLRQVGMAFLSFAPFPNDARMSEPLGQTASPLRKQPSDSTSTGYESAMVQPSCTATPALPETSDTATLLLSLDELVAMAFS